MNGCHGGEIENEAGSYGKEDTSVSPNDVVEDLSYGLVDNILKGVGWIAAAIGQHYGEEPSSDPSEAKREGNGPRRFDFGVLDFFGNVSSRIVISHGPRG